MRFNKGGKEGGSSFERPPVGYAVGVLCAIYDLGVRETPGSSFGPRHQICLWWELSHLDSKGSPHTLRDVVTMSTMEGSNLSTRMEALLGRDLTPQERENFDPGSVLGRRCKLLLAVSPKKPDGSPFVKAAMPAEATDAQLVVQGDYRSSLPRFVEKLVGDPAVLERMKREAAAGGGDLVVVAPKGQVVLPGRAPSQAQVAPTAAPPPPPPPPEPVALPKGWREVTTPAGKTYYVGPDGRPQWEPPGAPTPPPPPPAPAKRGRAAAAPPPPPEPAVEPAGDDDIPF